MGHGVAEIDGHLHICCLEGVDGELVVFLRFARYVENCRTVDEDALVLYLKFPIHVESLRHFQPIFNGDIVSLVKFGFAVDVEGFSDRRKIGCANELIEKGRAIGNGEEERCDVFFIFDFRNFVVFGHSERVVHDFIFCLSIWIDINKLFSSEVVILALSANRPLYLPCFSSWVFQDNLLSGLLSHHTIEFQLLDGFLRLWNAFSDEVNIQRVCTFDRAFDFEADIIIRDIRMEGNIEMQVLMREQVAFFRRNGEILTAEGSIPFEF